MVERESLQLITTHITNTKTTIGITNTNTTIRPTPPSIQAFRTQISEFASQDCIISCLRAPNRFLQAGKHPEFASQDCITSCLRAPNRFLQAGKHPEILEMQTLGKNPWNSDFWEHFVQFMGGGGTSDPSRQVPPPRIHKKYSQKLLFQWFLPSVRMGCSKTTLKYPPTNCTNWSQKSPFQWFLLGIRISAGASPLESTKST